MHLFNLDSLKNRNEFTFTKTEFNALPKPAIAALTSRLALRHLPSVATCRHLPKNKIQIKDLVTSFEDTILVGILSSIKKIEPDEVKRFTEKLIPYEKDFPFLTQICDAAALIFHHPTPYKLFDEVIFFSTEKEVYNATVRNDFNFLITKNDQWFTDKETIYKHPLWPGGKNWPIENNEKEFKKMCRKIGKTDIWERYKSSGFDYLSKDPNN